MNFELSPEKLLTLLSGVLEKGNRDRCIRIFYDVAKVVHYRQTRLNKSQLKMKEITSAIILVDFYHTSTYRFAASGDLASNFGKFPEGKAIDYFEKSVMGTVTDSFGRTIKIEDSGLRSIYKEKYTGKHVVASENYEEVRGKRLPWIRHVIEKSRSIYKIDENVSGRFRRTYLYTAVASISLGAFMDHAYFVVVVAQDANGNLRFVTAFPIQSHNRFLSRIEPGMPFLGS